MARTPLLSLKDGYYDPATGKSYDPADRPFHAEILAVAIDIAHARRLYEGCFMARAQAFGELTGFQQTILVQRYDAALYRRFRRAIRNLHPDVVRLFLKRETGRPVIDAASLDALRGDLVGQLNAIAVASAEHAKRRASRRAKDEAEG